jgi:hypothetical protein
MESVIKSDIFFFITSISIIVISVFVVIVLVHLIRILRNFYKISKTLRNYAESAEVGLRDLGEHIMRSPLFTFIFGKEKSPKEKGGRVKKV